MSRSKQLPAQNGGAVKLAWRLLRTGNRAAYHSMALAALGVLATPLDLLMSRGERRLYESAPERSNRLVFVCGPPRSGTTLVARTLIHCFDVAYVSNLMSLFPRSPLTALRRFGGQSRPDLRERQYYGRTPGLSGVNDGLPLWDRWLGPDRTRIVERLKPGTAEAMRRFFSALDAQTGRPLINKNNRLNCCAALVAEALPQARFICLRREPLFLAQSLLRARTEIVGSPRVAYGVDGDEPSDDDPIADVGRQLSFHRKLESEQLNRLGADRFRVVSYESFCRDPQELVRWVGREWLDLEPDAARMDTLEPFRVSRDVRVPPEVFAKLESLVAELPG